MRAATDKEETTDEEAEEADSSELDSADALAPAAKADAGTITDPAVTEEASDHKPRVTTREGVHLGTEMRATLKVVAEETMTKVRVQDEADAMAAEEMTTIATDQEEKAREEEEEAHVVAKLIAQDLEVREAANRELQLPSDHRSTSSLEKLTQIG